jgi:acetyltransferase-like isoleucine patch superfamily enzyme
VRELSPLVSHAAATVFAVRRRWYALRYPKLVLGPGVMFIGRLRLSQGTRLILGDRTRVRGKVTINGGGQVEVGSDSLLNGCWIIAADRVTIGDHCLVSDCGVTDNDFHNLPPELRHEPPGPRTRAPVKIGRNVWLGAHSLVLKGSTIGDDSVIGAGSVVRGDVASGVVVAGNPAVVVKTFRVRDGSGFPNAGEPRPGNPI